MSHQDYWLCLTVYLYLYQETIKGALITWTVHKYPPVGRRFVLFSFYYLRLENLIETWLPHCPGSIISPTQPVGRRQRIKASKWKETRKWMKSNLFLHEWGDNGISWYKKHRVTINWLLICIIFYWSRSMSYWNSTGKLVIKILQLKGAHTAIHSRMRVFFICLLRFHLYTTLWANCYLLAATSPSDIHFFLSNTILIF